MVRNSDTFRESLSMALDLYPRHLSRATLLHKPRALPGVTPASDAPDVEVDLPLRPEQRLKDSPTCWQDLEMVDGLRVRVKTVEDPPLQDLDLLHLQLDSHPGLLLATLPNATTGTQLNELAVVSCFQHGKGGQDAAVEEWVVQGTT